MTKVDGFPAPAITSDNIHLSPAIPPCAGDAVVSNPLSPLTCTDPKVLEFIAAATAPNTRHAYQSDLRHFQAWGGSLPAAPEHIARHLADYAAILSMASLPAASPASAQHTLRGFPIRLKAR